MWLDSWFDWIFGSRWVSSASYPGSRFLYLISMWFSFWLYFLPLFMCIVYVDLLCISSFPFVFTCVCICYSDFLIIHFRTDQYLWSIWSPDPLFCDRSFRCKALKSWHLIFAWGVLSRRHGFIPEMPLLDHFLLFHSNFSFSFLTFLSWISQWLLFGLFILS